MSPSRGGPTDVILFTNVPPPSPALSCSAFPHGMACFLPVSSPSVRFLYVSPKRAGILVCSARFYLPSA